MRSVICLVMVLGLGVVGCGNNACEDAVEKLEDECDIDLGDSAPDEDEASECAEDDECVAESPRSMSHSSSSFSTASSQALLPQPTTPRPSTITRQITLLMSTPLLPPSLTRTT